MPPFDAPFDRAESVTVDGTHPPLSNDELEARIGELAGHLNAASYRWLLLIAEFDRRNAWAAAGALSCAHWLNFRCGLDPGAAREKLRVAKALGSLPRVSEAMRRGELSYSKARALTRVASPATESELLSIALHGTASQLETIVRQFRRVQETAELSRARQQQASRALIYSWEEDGSLSLRVRLPAEGGAIVLRALEAAIQALPPDENSAAPKTRDVSAETSPGTGAPSVCANLDAIDTSRRRRADALALLAESFLAHGAEALTGGERQQIVVHVDAEALRNAAPGRCELEDGPALAAETVRRLSCDASLVTIVEDADGNPLDIGRKTRSIPPSLRRALRARDRGCRFPGCTHQRYVDAHHIEHWAHGGATKLSNLVSLCRYHHGLLHEGGWRLEALDEGALRFIDPWGRTLPGGSSLRELLHGAGAGAFPPECGDDSAIRGLEALAAQHACAGLHIDARTSATRWRGERLDHDIAIAMLCERVERAAPRTT